MPQVDLDKNPALIQSMFTRIADRYDLLNRLISLGFDQTLRRALVTRLMESAPSVIADIGCGTGDVSILLAKTFPESCILACDMTWAMIQVGRQRTQHPAIQWVVCDSMDMPFAAAALDGCISAYLLRNVVDLPCALQEQARITREEGTFLALEMTPPRKTFLYPLVWLYFHSVIPLLGWLVAGNPQAYQYLPASSMQFYPAEELSRLIGINGWQDAQVSRKFFGLMAIHQAQKKSI
jgi:demethylmenaquinone methyltransferase/2-methoxy-6-polyprenyl-1,4-benzoquinol methylase